MADLVEFLRARLDEEADYAQMVIRESVPKVFDADPPDRWDGMRLFALKRGDDLMAITPARVLAEVEAKRRIIDDCWEDLSMRAKSLGLEPSQVGTLSADILLALAQPYADHEAFQSEWKLDV